MDLTGRKKRIANLEEALADNKRLIDINAKGWAEANEKNDQLIKKIRDMDQLIFSISQCSSWPQMQPIVAKLCAMTNDRMIDESSRIRDVLIPEIRKTYLK